MSQESDNASRFYNPPEQIPGLGRILVHGSYEELIAQLRHDEILIAYGRPRVDYFTACHINSAARKDEIEQSWWARPTYYAVETDKVAPGFDPPLNR